MEMQVADGVLYILLFAEDKTIRGTLLRNCKKHINMSLKNKIKEHTIFGNNENGI
jgi:hypothetical protein